MPTRGFRALLPRRATGLLLAAALGLSALPATARAEIGELKIAIQYGLGYLPLLVAKNQRLIEKHAEAQGAGKLAVSWTVLNGGAAGRRPTTPCCRATPTSSAPASRRC